MKKIMPKILTNSDKKHQHIANQSQKKKNRNKILKTMRNM